MLVGISLGAQHLQLYEQAAGDQSDDLMDCDFIAGRRVTSGLRQNAAE